MSELNEWAAPEGIRRGTWKERCGHEGPEGHTCIRTITKTYDDVIGPPDPKGWTRIESRTLIEADACDHFYEDDIARKMMAIAMRWVGEEPASKLGEETLQLLSTMPADHPYHGWAREFVYKAGRAHRAGL